METTNTQPLPKQELPKPKKIAVLGGGPSAMAAVYYILEAHNWNKDLVDITVYQLGWRLGGKCASGRNTEQHARVEEHGIHFWFGAYHNSFRWIRDCYERLAKTGYAPYSWQDALIPAPAYIGFEHLKDGWDMWRVKPFAWKVPPAGALPLPPEDAELPHYLSDYVKAGLELMIEHTENEHDKIEPEEHEGLLPSLLALLKTRHRQNTAHALEKLRTIRLQFSGLAAAGNFQKTHPDVLRLVDEVESLNKFIGSVFYDYLEEHQTLRRIFVVLDLGTSILKGLLNDDVFSKGMDSINHLDFIQWLRKHGAASITLENTLVTSYYDGSFAYRDGDKRFPNSEAGTTLKGILIALLTCNTSMFFKFRGSMGEVVFTPFYLLLKEHGVKFKFFHKVQNLKLSADKSRIEAIEMEKQVHLKSGNDDDYDPLVSIKGVQCWPSKPKYELLQEGEELKKQWTSANANLESFWTSWKGAPLVLQEGQDFDEVIFGIPVGSVPFLCTELLSASAAWQDMAAHLETVPTQSLQLWTTRSRTDMGWPFPDCGVYTTFTEPLDTWCSNPDLVPLEDWPAYKAPKDVFFFTGVLRDPGLTPPANFHQYPAFMKQKVFSQFLEFLVDDISIPFPKVRPSKGLNDWFNWSVLHDSKAQLGYHQLSAQYYRANIDPSERYVLSVENSSRYRLATDATGFQNLYITGDWIQTPLNSGCFEAAMMAGILTARAITKQPLTIIGEHAFQTQGTAV